jgi:recombinational DNA repair protein RecR
MTKLPEGRKPLPKEWFVDRARAITPMTKEERQRAREKAKANMYGNNKCVSCGNISTGDFCEFCLKEE